MFMFVFGTLCFLICSSVLTEEGSKGTEKQLELGHVRKSSNNERVRRDNSVFFVDVLLITDYSIYRREYNRTYFILKAEERRRQTIQNIREYFAYVMDGVKHRFKTLPGIKTPLAIRLIGYVIKETADESPWTENETVNSTDGGKVDSRKVLTSFKSWVAGSPLPNSDHVMLFTGYDLYRTEENKRISNRGLTDLASLCKSDGLSTSVVEDHGDFQSIEAAAHVLGHSLGAKHDGDGNSCSANDQYIMAATTQSRTDPNNTNHWTFSNCSVTYFNNYMTYLMNTENGTKCLMQKLPAVNVSVVEEKLGQIYSPDAQCQKLRGPGSKLCREHQFNRNNICNGMYCLESRTNSCITETAFQGTTCGDKKWCINGVCIYSSNAPSVGGNCSDSSSKRFDGKSCSALVEESPSACYLDYVNTHCCDSCERASTGRRGQSVCLSASRHILTESRNSNSD